MLVSLAVVEVLGRLGTLPYVLLLQLPKCRRQPGRAGAAQVGKEPRHRSREAADVDKWGGCLALWSPCLLTDAADKYIAKYSVLT